MPSLRTITVGPTGKDYTSLNAALQVGIDLVTADEYAEIVCDDFEDTTAVADHSGAGWVTDATHTITIKPAGAGFPTSYATADYRLNINATNCIKLTVSHTKIERVGMRCTGSSACYALRMDVADQITVDGCWIEINSASPPSTNFYGLSFLYSYTGNQAWVRNTVVIGDRTLSNSWGLYQTSPQVTLHSCTFADHTLGFQCSNHVRVQAKNVLITDCATCFEAGTYDGDCTNNASDDASAPGANAQTGTAPTFEGSTLQPASGDTICKGNGADLSSDSDLAVTTDIAGTTRLATPTIGAWEAVAASTPAPTGVNVRKGNAKALMWWSGDASHTEYRLYRSTSSGTKGSLVKTVVVATDLYNSDYPQTIDDDVALANGTEYWWTIEAYDGSSTADSAQVNATPHLKARFAQGRNRENTAGDTSNVVTVSNLADYDEDAGEAVIANTLRWAIETQAGSKVVDITTSGYIDLKKPLENTTNGVTVLGAAAASPGVAIGGAPLRNRGNNCIFADLSFILGNHGATNPKTYGDCLSLWGDGPTGPDETKGNYSIALNCGFIGHFDECAELTYGAEGGFEACLCLPGLNNGLPRAENNHNYGSLLDGKLNGRTTTQEVTAYRNVYGGFSNRTPEVYGDPDNPKVMADVRGNVIVAAKSSGYLSNLGGNAEINAVDNSFFRGNTTNSYARELALHAADRPIPIVPVIYHTGNRGASQALGSATEPDVQDAWQNATVDAGYTSGTEFDLIPPAEKHAANGVNGMNATDVQNIIDAAGPNNRIALFDTYVTEIENVVTSSTNDVTVYKQLPNITDFGHTAPSAPTGLAGSQSSHSTYRTALLTWSTAPESTIRKYEIERSDDGGTSWDLVGYVYDEAPVVIGTPGDGQATFAWPAVTGATQYQVEKFNGSTWDIVQTSAATQYVATGPNGTEIMVHVTALFSSRSGGTSHDETATPASGADDSTPEVATAGTRRYHDVYNGFNSKASLAVGTYDYRVKSQAPLVYSPASSSITVEIVDVDIATAPGVALDQPSRATAPGVAFDSHSIAKAPGIALDVQGITGIATAPGVAFDHRSIAKAPGIAFDSHSIAAAPGAAYDGLQLAGAVIVVPARDRFYPD